MSRYRTAAWLLLTILSVYCLICSYHWIRADKGLIFQRRERILFLLVLLTALLVLSHDLAVFQYKKHAVLSASTDLLSRLGRHLIIGYREPAEVMQLLEKRAIGGVYITARNIRNKSMEEVRRELGLFQSAALKNGGPPLFLAADQEGGGVSRLSPLLNPMPALASVVASHPANEQRAQAVKAYAAAQAKQLAGLGINLNLSPVVDLKTDRRRHKRNVRTRIDQRAISAHTDTVTEVAGFYCAVLLDHGVRPTLKHFPGLGSVMEDTHFNPGTLDRSKEILEGLDWRPFMEITAQTDPFIMLGHVSVPCVDPWLPASLSPNIITDIIRREWKFDGVLITDDFNMGAIAKRKEGMGKSAVRALNAGADLILLSYDGSQYYNVMYELIEADQKGVLNQAALKKSSKRLLACSPPRPAL